MKFFLVILALFVIASQAAVEPNNIDYETEIDDVVNEARYIDAETTSALERHLDEILGDSSIDNEIDEAFQTIDDRMENDGECAVAQEKATLAIADVMFLDKTKCRVTAAETAIEIVLDMGKATKQIIVGGVRLQQTRRKCKKYNSSFMKRTCNIQLAASAALYLNSARSSLKTLRESIFVRIPILVQDTKTCLNSANYKTLLQLKSVNNEIDMCIIMA